MGKFDVDVEDIKREFQSAEKLSFARFFASVLQDMDTEARDMFDTGGKGKWKALATSTLRRKVKAGRSTKALIWSSNWMNHPSLESGETYAEIGTNLSYPMFHISDAPRSKIPLRDPYAFDDAFFDPIFDRLAEYAASNGQKGL